MEKITTKQVIEERREHSFYCDDCGIHLGTSIEDDECYYNSFGGFELSTYINNDGWYRVKKCLCDDCRTKFLNNFISNLISMGFKKE